MRPGGLQLCIIPVHRSTPAHLTFVMAKSCVGVELQQHNPGTLLTSATVAVAKRVPGLCWHSQDYTESWAQTP